MTPWNDLHYYVVYQAFVMFEVAVADPTQLDTELIVPWHLKPILSGPWLESRPKPRKRSIPTSGSPNLDLLDFIPICLWTFMDCIFDTV